MKNALNKFFKIEESGSTIGKELLAGATTFFTMCYILFVNPNMLSPTGMPAQGIFLATIFASIIGTLVMGLFANVPYAQAPGMGLNSFFTYTVCFGMGFTWQEALGMVLICGIINIIITVTKIRKYIIKAIPRDLQLAIGAGIGMFIAYLGFVNGGLISFGAVPGIAAFNTAGALIALFGIVLTVVLFMFKVKGSMIIGILGATLISIIYFFASGKNFDDTEFTFAFSSLGDSFSDLGTIFGAAFGGIGSLFSGKSVDKIFLAIGAIFAFSITDTFDTIGTFIGTGRRSGIFSDADLSALENSKGFKSKMDKALFADSIATSIGAVLGTSNTTTYVESASGIEAGGRTGLTSVMVAVLFALSIFLAPVIGLVTQQATACALVMVGIMMMSSLKEIDWHDLEVAIPAFFATLVMAITYSISNGIGLGFIFYVIVKLCRGKAKEINPVLWVCTALFVGYFITMALI